MRLLSFLTEIERAICLEANASEGAVWDSSRIVNFKNGLGRLTLTLRDHEAGLPEGTIMLQNFDMANGSFCLKASLGWQGSDTATVIAVYDTPLLNWKLEASRIASTWLAGAVAEIPTAQPSAEMESMPLAAEVVRPDMKGNLRERVAIAVAG
jgi:hypothetical protein